MAFGKIGRYIGLEWAGGMVKNINSIDLNVNENNNAKRNSHSLFHFHGPSNPDRQEDNDQANSQMADSPFVA